ncbi:hypothetical protein Hanom_Chr04g00352441 [Helianthus anomalus]
MLLYSFPVHNAFNSPLQFRRRSFSCLLSEFCLCLFRLKFLISPAICLVAFSFLLQLRCIAYCVDGGR